MKNMGSLEAFPARFRGFITTLTDWKQALRVGVFGVVMFSCAGHAVAQAPLAMSFCSDMRLLQAGPNNWVAWGSPSSGFAGLQSSLWTQSIPSNGFNRVRRLQSFETLFATPLDPTRRALQIGCDRGGNTAHALLSDGSVVGWGANANGQIGNGNTTSLSLPTPVVNLTAVVSLAGGSNHTLALRSNGTVAAWGRNTSGQVADGTFVTSRPIPSEIAGISSAVAVAAGADHSLALLSNGTVRAWGANGSGQLGNGLTTSQSAPVQVANLTGVTAIAAGENFSLALRSDGTVWAWGRRFEGAMGDGGGGLASQLTPIQVPVANIRAITTNRAGTVFALDGSGRVWGWGQNESSNTLLGPQRTSCSRCTPEVVTGLPQDISQVFAYNSSAFAVTSDGTIFGWGSNFFQQLALGRNNTTDVPNAFATPQPAVQGGGNSDFNRSYTSDILFRNSSSGDVWLWNIENNAIASSAGIGVVPNEWRIVATADIDRDGKRDLIWRNAETGENTIWLMDNRALKGIYPLETVGNLNWVIAATADFNADGRPDLLWRNEAEALYAVWLLGPTGVIQTRAYGGVPSNWEVRGAADFTGNGKSSIIWRDSGSGAVAIHRMDGVVFNGSSFLAGGLSEWEIVAIDDFCRCGVASILMRYFTGGTLARVILNSSAQAISSTTFIPAAGGAWNISAVGDFDGDSFLDFLWRDTSGEMVIWKLNGNLVRPGANSVQQFEQGTRFLGNPGNVWQVIR